MKTYREIHYSTSTCVYSRMAAMSLNVPNLPSTSLHKLYKHHLPSFNSWRISLVLWKLISSNNCSNIVGGFKKEDAFANAIVSHPYGWLNIYLYCYPNLVYTWTNTKRNANLLQQVSQLVMLTHNRSKTFHNIHHGTFQQTSILAHLTFTD